MFALIVRILLMSPKNVNAYRIKVYINKSIRKLSLFIVGIENTFLKMFLHQYVPTLDILIRKRIFWSISPGLIHSANNKDVLSLVCRL